MQKFLLLLILSFSMTAFSQKKEWQDPELNAINRAPMRATFFAFSSAEMAEIRKNQSEVFNETRIVHPCCFDARPLCQHQRYG